MSPEQRGEAFAMINKAAITDNQKRNLHLAQQCMFDFMDDEFDHDKRRAMDYAVDVVVDIMRDILGDRIDTTRTNKKLHRDPIIIGNMLPPGDMDMDMLAAQLEVSGYIVTTDKMKTLVRKIAADSVDNG